MTPLAMVRMPRGISCPPKGMRGLTLWELACVLGITSVLLGLAVPAFTTLAQNARQAADMNAFVTAIQTARSEATKRGRPAVLCKTLDTYRCGGDEIGFDAGWMVFINDDDLRPPHRGPDEPLVTTWQPRSEGPILANRRLFEFRPFRRRSTNGTVTFCDRRGATAARAVIVSYTGRPRVSPKGPGNRALRCARVT